MLMKKFTLSLQLKSDQNRCTDSEWRRRCDIDFKTSSPTVDANFLQQSLSNFVTFTASINLQFNSFYCKRSCSSVIEKQKIK